MKTIEIYDPALCCPTGLCGPKVNPELLRIATQIETLSQKGVKIERHNLRDEPQLYVTNEIINNYLQEHGVEALPITLVDGEVTVAGKYPTTAQLSEWSGVELKNEFKYKP